jgi:transcriptional regulator with XRE-family HTH domain
MIRMRYKQLREALRRARRAKALSQAALAASSGTSRVTVARLEGGATQDVRVGTVERLCEVLGLELAALPVGTPASFEARLARSALRAQNLERRLAHARLAANLLASRPDRARALVRRARGVVDRWEREQLCSDHYISRWRRLLSGPVGRVAAGLLDPGDWEDALFQNTPWSFALGTGVP